MEVNTGTDAGKVWQYLQVNQAATPTSIMSGIKLSRTEVDRAIGWLAREGKIQVIKKGRQESLSLA